MRENENWELTLQASQKQKITIMKKLSCKFLSGEFYSQTPIQNYQNNKSKNYYRGIKWEENQKVTKVKTRKKGEQWQG